MAEATFTQADLDALNGAIAMGARRVRYSDKEIEYRTLREMLDLRDLMRRELGLIKPTLRIHPNHSKNL